MGNDGKRLLYSNFGGSIAYGETIYQPTTALTSTFHSEENQLK